MQKMHESIHLIKNINGTVFELTEVKKKIETTTLIKSIQTIRIL